MCVCVCVCGGEWREKCYLRNGDFYALLATRGGVVSDIAEFLPVWLRGLIKFLS